MSVMSDRRDYTNQHGVYTPTESEAIYNIDGKKPKTEKKIYVKPHASVLREEDLKELDRCRRKTFAEFVKEELEKEEHAPTPASVEEKAENMVNLRRAYSRAYYAENKEKFRENQRRYRERHKEKVNADARAYYRRRKYGADNEPDIDTGHTYVDIDGIRLVKEGKKIVAWYRPDGWLE